MSLVEMLPDIQPLIAPNQSYHVWSPDLAFSAAEVMLQVLRSEKG